MPPNSTLATATIRGKKRSKARLTVMICTNATGSYKMKPFVIGKVARPRCFGKTFKPEFIGIKYQNNKKAWQPTITFHEWVHELNSEMKKQGRHICLVLENATNHAFDLELSNIVLESFRPNMTAYLQPCDAGIIRNFKLYYRQRQVRHVLECIELEKEMKVNVKEALQFFSGAWDAVTPNYSELLGAHKDNSTYR